MVRLDGRSIEEYEAINKLNAKWILGTFYWGSIERVQGTFDFTYYDTFVNLANQNGTKVIGILAYEAPWLFAPGEARPFISSENIPHFLSYVETTVKHFSGRVDAWQIWNEPNWIFWKGTNKQFFEFSRLVAERIKETNPDAYIIGGGFMRVPGGFIRNMYKAGAMENLDGISFHPYGVNPRGSMKLYDKFLDLLGEINFPGEVWITEIGYPTSGIYPSRVSLNNLPSYVIKSLAGAAARGARALIWYELSDSYNKGEAPNSTDSELFFGLIYPDWSRKNGAWAYELCARYLPGSRFAPDLPLRENVSSNIVSYCFINESTGYNALILWNDRNRTQSINLSLSSVVTLHDISTGNSNSIHGSTTLEISREPVFLTWQGNAVPEIIISQ